jgi:hypothetical protein
VDLDLSVTDKINVDSGQVFVTANPNAGEHVDGLAAV